MLHKNFTDNNFTSSNGDKAMTNLIKQWLSYVELRRCDSTAKTYKSVMQTFIDTLPFKIVPCEIKPKHIEQFIQVLRQNHAANTTNTYLNILKSFYHWAENHHGFTNVTAHIARLREPDSKRRILSNIEYEHILCAAKNLDAKTVQFLANTGLRRNEFRFLTWADFNGDFVYVIGKGNKKRHVPLNKICKRVLDGGRSGDCPPFIKKYRPYNSLYKLCARLSQKANVPHFYPHSFRHFFATRLIKAGVPLMVVSRILGHSDTQTTEKIYVHLVPDDLRVTDCLED